MAHPSRSTARLSVGLFGWLDPRRHVAGAEDRHDGRGRRVAKRAETLRTRGSSGYPTCGPAADAMATLADISLGGRGHPRQHPLYVSLFSHHPLGSSWQKRQEPPHPPRSRIQCPCTGGLHLEPRADHRRPSVWVPHRVSLLCLREGWTTKDSSSGGARSGGGLGINGRRARDHVVWVCPPAGWHLTRARGGTGVSLWQPPLLARAVGQRRTRFADGMSSPHRYWMRAMQNYRRVGRWCGDEPRWHTREGA